jgi:hypothetical protein
MNQLLYKTVQEDNSQDVPSFQDVDDADKDAEHANLSRLTLEVQDDEVLIFLCYYVCI